MMIFRPSLILKIIKVGFSFLGGGGTIIICLSFGFF